MSLWPHFRRLACLSLMLALLAAGGWAWLRGGSPEDPFGGSVHLIRFNAFTGDDPPRGINPFVELSGEYDNYHLTRRN